MAVSDPSARESAQARGAAVGSRSHDQRAVLLHPRQVSRAKCRATNGEDVQASSASASPDDAERSNCRSNRAASPNEFLKSAQ